VECDVQSCAFTGMIQYPPSIWRW